MRYLFIGYMLIFILSGCEDKLKNNDVSQSAPKSEVLAKIGSEAMVLEIGASSCSACIDMKKKIDSLKLENPDLPIYIVDVYKNRDIVNMFKIQMIPTQIALNAKGEEVHRHVGGLSSDEILKLIELSKK